MASVFSRRIGAYIIDFFVVSAFMWILSYLFSLIINPADVGSVYRYFPYLAPILGYVYFVFCEKVKGATVGKAFYWIPIIFDWLIGRIMNTDRLFGSITRTVVVNSVN